MSSFFYFIHYLIVLWHVIYFLIIMFHFILFPERIESFHFFVGFLLSQLKLCRHTTCWQKVCEGSAKTCHTGLHWAFKMWGGPTGNSNFDTFKIKGNASGKNPTLSLYCACHRLDSLSLVKKPEDTCVAIPVKTCS